MVAGVHPDRLREVASHLVTGVTVVTADTGSEKLGCTANAVTSLSLEPPLMLICLKRSSRTRDAVVETGAFAINLLGSDPESHELCHRFATNVPDRFAGVGYTTGGTGAPVLDKAVAWLECRLHETFESGDHTVCVGLVVDADADAGIAPLAFLRGRFFGVEPPG